MCGFAILFVVLTVLSVIGIIYFPAFTMPNEATIAGWFACWFVLTLSMFGLFGHSILHDKHDKHDRDIKPASISERYDALIKLEMENVK